MTKVEQQVDADARWQSRRALAWTLRIALFVAPIAASVAFVLIASRQVPRPPGLAGVVAWWVGITAAATIILRIVDRSLQRFVPVVTLLRLSLVFPDKAPSRFRLALRTGTVKQFKRQLEDGARPDTPQDTAEMLLTLAGRLGEHDRLTRGHSERVRAYSALIAEEMGLKQSERDLLQWAALLHDIGKLDVPSELLNKNERPTDDEWAVIREHPAKAAIHLAPLAPWLGDWRLAALEHHERWDGGGYPRGLRTDHISLAGRIVAVADAYDTITSVRSYKTAATAEQGRLEIARCSGSQFDPAVVRAFLAVSVGRLRGIMGPLSWLANAPILATVPTAAAPTVTSTLTAGAAVMTMGVAGLAVPPPEPVPEVAVVEELPTFELAFAEPTISSRPIDLPPLSLPTPTATVNATDPAEPVFVIDFATPTTAPTEQPTSGPTTPPPATSTPAATPTPVPGATPTPSPPPTATPAPTATPEPTATPNPTPTPTPASGQAILLYLENPGSGPTASSPVLPMTTALPEDFLYNFDTDRDNDDGLLLRRTSKGLAETDPTKVQLWSENLAGTTVSGQAALTLHAAPHNFDWDDEDFFLTVAVQHCDAGLTSCTTLASATEQVVRIGSPWFSPVAIDLGPVAATFTSSEPLLVVRVLVPNTSESRMRVAYDTWWHGSNIKISGS